jgi:hypothetical protein
MPDEQKTGLEKTEDALKVLNAIVAEVSPLAVLAVSGGRALVALLRKNGLHAEADAYEAELLAYQAARADVRAALDEFHAKYDAPAPPSA